MVKGDLIDNITQAIKKSNIKEPIIDLTYDDNNKVFGYITSKSFENKTDSEAQKIIWDSLRKYIDREELLRIFMIFHETPQERLLRMPGSDNVDLNSLGIKSNFWYHEAPENNKYWAFIDAIKIKNYYQSIYIVLNAKNKFHKGIKFNYTKEVLEFLEINDDNFYSKLMANAYNSALEEIRGDLMSNYDKQTSQGRIGKNNLYEYIFSSFNLKPCSLSNIIFSKEEIRILTKLIPNLKGFKIESDIVRAIEIANLFNSNQEKIN